VLLLRGTSIANDVAAFASTVGSFGVGSTENGSQSDSTFLSILTTHILPAWRVEEVMRRVLRASWQRRLSRTASWASSSHSSTLLQPCDRGPMAAFKRAYELEMATMLHAASEVRINDVQRVQCVARAADAVRMQPGIIKSGFARSGLALADGTLAIDRTFNSYVIRNASEIDGRRGGD
jgi:hypothetical protein